ncbi:MmgE/PrpD family protein [Colletotrichum scovillei]|uniref:MmgE/PrpD family protein n=1 Tax=Colletotrichum scovillei TaxID=1209932 RepID=A0A9P7UHB5_9PEZI|nr:MmgE/PrpD family protein [Colletotrichum scovillei]
MASGNYTIDLARFAASLTSKALPKSLYSSLPILVLDIVTAMLTGMVQPVYKSSTEALTTIHGNGGPQSVAAIDGSETTIFGAMYLNGIAAGAFQIEHVVLNAHPSSSVLPALLVYASTRNTTTTGEDFLTALAAGYEVCARIGLASGASVEDERGFHNPAINGQLAAAAAVGNLLGWDAETIASAMGVAASSSGGLVAFQTTDAKTKQIHPGHGGPLGIEAALMARAGVTGPPNILENDMGFLHAFSPEPNVTALTDQLGNRWDCEATTAKHYPMHSRFQTLVSGVQDYKKKDPWDKEVKGITAYVGPRLLREAHQIAHPETLDQAQYSVLFCLAASVLLDLSSPFVFDDTLLRIIPKFLVLRLVTLTKLVKASLQIFTRHQLSRLKSQEKPDNERLTIPLLTIPLAPAAVSAATFSASLSPFSASFSSAAEKASRSIANMVNKEKAVKRCETLITHTRLLQQTIGHAYARTIAQRAVALEASQAALAASNSQMSASEIAKLTEKFKIGTAEEIPIIEEQGGIALTSEEIVAQDALSVVRAGMLEEEIIGAEAIAAARGLARAGIYGLIAAVVIFGAMELFSSLREDAQAAKLKAIIDKTSTARLYVQVEEKTAVAYSSLNAEIENIAEAYVDRETKPQKFQKALDRFTKSAGNLLPNVDEVYAQLFEGDAQGGSWVGDDPSLEQMKSMHDDEIRVRNS